MKYNFLLRDLVNSVVSMHRTLSFCHSSTLCHLVCTIITGVIMFTFHHNMVTLSVLKAMEQNENV
jgi:hypothetical protein